MDELFSSGRAIDLVIAVLAIEAVVVWGLMRRAHALPSLLAGFGLLLAWRFAQGGAAWSWVAVALAAAGMAHGWDLWQRWPRR